MDTINTIIQKINNITRNKPIYYLSNDIERSLGLETLIENYHMVCIDDNPVIDYIKEKNSNVFCLSRELGSNNTVYRSSIKLLEHDLTKKYISQSNEKYIQTFKISPRFQYLVKSLNAESLNTTAILNRIFENKISQYQVLSENKIQFPKTIITTLANITFQQITQAFSSKFVIQFNRGHTGESTLIIENEQQFNDIKQKFSDRQIKIVEYVDSNYSYTVNCCITSNGFYFGGISYQITGVKELTSFDKATVGNDFTQREGFDEFILSQLNEQLKKISEVMFSKGFKGMFGVDFIIKDEKIFIIEINARQTQSVPFFTKLQLKNDQIPLSMLHLCEYMGIPVELNPEEYNKFNLQKYNASQVYLRSKEIGFNIKNDVKPGKYAVPSKDFSQNNASLIFIKKAYSIDDIYRDDEMIVLTKQLGTNVNLGDEVVRIQFLSNATDRSFNVNSWILTTLLSIEKNLK